MLDHRGLIRLTDVLDMMLEKAKESEAIVTEDEFLVLIDVLKALFNLTCGYDDRVCDEEEASLMKRVAKIIQTLIMINLAYGENKYGLVGYAHCSKMALTFEHC